MLSFYSIFKILEAMNSKYAACQTIKVWNFSIAYVMIKNIDEVEILARVNIVGEKCSKYLKE